MDAEQWNERYRASDGVWSTDPNQALVAAAPPPPQAGARALDLGCGEGADAIWLASQGWDVVGVDWAQVALDRARRAASAAGQAERARFVVGDATDPVFLRGLSPSGTFDLITLAFVHPEPEDRAHTYAHLPFLLAPGGHLMLITHDPEHGRRGLPGPPPHRLLGCADILAALGIDQHPELAVERSDVVERQDAAGDVVAVDAVVVVCRLMV